MYLPCGLTGFTKWKKSEIGRSQWLRVHEKSKNQVQLIITYGVMKNHKVKVLIDAEAIKNFLSMSVAKKLSLMLMKNMSE